MIGRLFFSSGSEFVNIGQASNRHCSWNTAILNALFTIETFFNTLKTINRKSEIRKPSFQAIGGHAFHTFHTSKPQ